METTMQAMAAAITHIRRIVKENTIITNITMKTVAHHLQLFQEHHIQEIPFSYF
jgi:hypothetical protein